LKRVFADIHAGVCSKELLDLYYKMGYTHIACLEKHVDSSTLSSNVRVVIVDKVVVNASNVDELKDILRDIEYRRKVVAVHPTTTETARWSVHDTRIDTILITPSNLKVLDKKQLSVMKYYDKPLEVHIPHLLYSSSEVKSYFYRRLNMLARFKVGLVLGTSTSSMYELVHPVVVIKAMKTLYDLPEKITLLALTDIPRQIIFRKQVTT